MHEYVSMHVFILQKYDENCLASNYYYGLYRESGVRVAPRSLGVRRRRFETVLGQSTESDDHPNNNFKFHCDQLCI